jgi:hypothetical protein
MTVSHSIPTGTAAAICAATLALALTACGSNGSGAGSTRPTRVAPAHTLTEVDPPTGTHTLPQQRRCFPGNRCAE